MLRQRSVTGLPSPFTWLISLTKARSASRWRKQRQSRPNFDGLTESCCLPGTKACFRFFRTCCCRKPVVCAVPNSVFSHCKLRKRQIHFMIGAVDIGGTKIAVGLVDDQGRVLAG